MNDRTRPQVPIKVVIAKPGLDGHDRGAKVIARSLRDAGMEVVYTGIFQSPQSIVRTVIQEDAQVLGISSLAGGHLEYAADILALLRKEGASDVLVVLGGTIPERDAAKLMTMGITAVFGPGTPTSRVVEYIRDHAPRLRPTA
ncbi:MAG: cobalamin B12-binding domain-containing protein [bacterium]|nr:cobalamin B12-binding domain-containing protein [bacterium]